MNDDHAASTVPEGWAEYIHIVVKVGDLTEPALKDCEGQHELRVRVFGEHNFVSELEKVARDACTRWGLDAGDPDTLEELQDRIDAADWHLTPAAEEALQCLSDLLATSGDNPKLQKCAYEAILRGGPGMPYDAFSGLKRERALFLKPLQKRVADLLRQAQSVLHQYAQEEQLQGRLAAAYCETLDVPMYSITHTPYLPFCDPKHYLLIDKLAGNAHLRFTETLNWYMLEISGRLLAPTLGEICGSFGGVAEGVLHVVNVKTENKLESDSNPDDESTIRDSFRDWSREGYSSDDDDDELRPGVNDSWVDYVSKNASVGLVTGAGSLNALSANIVCETPEEQVKVWHQILKLFPGKVLRVSNPFLDPDMKKKGACMEKLCITVHVVLDSKSTWEDAIASPAFIEAIASAKRSEVELGLAEEDDAELDSVATCFRKFLEWSPEVGSQNVAMVAELRLFLSHYFLVLQKRKLWQMVERAKNWWDLVNAARKHIRLSKQ